MRIRAVPNETLLLPGGFFDSLGDLAQVLMVADIEHTVALEIDTSDRTRPGEGRGGASPLAGIALYLLGIASGEGVRLADRLFDVTVDWVKRHRSRDSQPISVTIYGPDGNVLKKVYVDTDGELRDHPV